MKTPQEILKENVIIDADNFIIKSIVQYANQFKNKPKWISVKDVMPEKAGDYLVIGERWSGSNVDVYIAYHHDKKYAHKFLSDCNDHGLDPITHWMHLPNPPSL